MKISDLSWGFDGQVLLPDGVRMLTSEGKTFTVYRYGDRIPLRYKLYVLGGGKIKKWMEPTMVDAATLAAWLHDATPAPKTEVFRTGTWRLTPYVPPKI